MALRGEGLYLLEKTGSHLCCLQMSPIYSLVACSELVGRCDGAAQEHSQRWVRCALAGEPALPTSLHVVRLSGVVLQKIMQGVEVETMILI